MPCRSRQCDMPHSPPHLYAFAPRLVPPSPRLRLTSLLRCFKILSTRVRFTLLRQVDLSANETRHAHASGGTSVFAALPEEVSERLTGTWSGTRLYAAPLNYKLMQES